MQRLIDADALKGQIANHVYPVADVFNSRDYGMFWTGGIEKAIDNAPTVDAEPVVRCKDCKKYIPCQKLPIGTSKWCDLFDRATCEMNYCGWAERREDAE